MKVLITKRFFPDDMTYILNHLNNGITLLTPSEYNEESIIALAPEADVLFGGLISEKLLSSAKNVRFFQIPWTGVDNLDFGLLRKYNVIVCNSHSNSTVVAEHAVALMMDAAKKISYHDRLMRYGNWNRIEPDQLNEISPFSTMISGSLVAIIGFGAIGNKIYELLKGYSCRFKIFDKDNMKIEDQDETLTIFSSDKIRKEIFDIDYVFTCVPLTPETSGLINNDFLSRMKKDAVLINISRGEVMNEGALYNALKTKTIAFAAVDTWFNYPTTESPKVFPSKRFEFHLLDNIILSPHRAGYIAGRFPHLDDAIENLNRSYLGKPLINVISLIDKY
jgi:phosphoglycerate dehydrogenase-like enzyme